MRITNIISALCLVTAASAIDILLHRGRQCDESYVQCTRINPDTCCGVPTGAYTSVYFNYIPEEWTLELRGYTGGSCRIRSRTSTPTNAINYCFFRGSYTGAGYGFRNRKRDIEGPSRKCQTPDTIGLPDGTQYSLKDLEEDQTTLILENLGNITTAADIPGGVERLTRLA